LSLFLSDGLKKIVEKDYFGKSGSIVVGEVNGHHNVFSSIEGFHTVFEVNMSVGKMFRILGATRGGERNRCGRSSRHIVDSALLNKPFVEELSSLVVHFFA
jgi:hypothetical protein